MRLIGRSKPEEPTTRTADFVLQLGSSKIQLPADRLVGASGRADDDTARHPDAATLNSNDEDKAVDAFMRMRQTLSSSSTTAAAGQWSPWSPDDFYSPHHPSEATNTSSSSLTAPELPLGWDRRPSNFLPEPYDPSQHQQQQPTYFCPAVPTGTMPLRSKPTIFDGLGEMPRRRASPTGEPRTRDSVSGKKSRRLDLAQLFPQRSPSTLNGPNSKSDTTRTGRSRSGTGLTSSTSTSGNTRRVHDFGDDVVQATKTNRRRPPKGIQNWFDGFISSDDDEEDEDEEEEEEEQAARTLVGPQVLPPVTLHLEPQELPGDDIAPPAYSGPLRGASISSQRSDKSYTPGDDNPPPFHHADEKPPLDRTQSVSTGTESLHSTQSQSRRASRMSRSKLATESVLALSDQSGSDAEEEARGQPRGMRDSIVDEQNVRLGSATRVNFQQARAPQELAAIRTRSSEAITSAPRESATVPSAPDAAYAGHPQRSVNPLDPTAVALRRLNGYSMGDSRTSTSSSSTMFELDSRSILATDSISNVPEGAHMMAVTEEERMLLDLMRRKRAAMQQVSFTEGYQLALRREQSSPMKRSASADSTAQQIIDHRETQTDMTSHEIIRQKLSVLQKQDVDEALKMARFLGMQSSSEEDVSWPRDSMMPSALPTSQPRSDAYVSEGYSPTHQEMGPSSPPWAARPEDYTADNQSKVRKYLASNGLPSPSSGPRLTRRTSTRNSVTTSPVLEEEPIPDIPDRNPDRGRQNQTSRPSQRLSRSMDAVPILHTAGLKYRSATFDAAAGAMTSPTNTTLSPSTTSPLSSIITAASLGDRHRRNVGSDTPDTETSHSGFGGPRRPTDRKIPAQIRTRENAMNQRGSMVSLSSAGEDVLAAWAELGGGSGCLQQKRRPQAPAQKP